MTATKHTHRTSGQVLTHDHPGGDRHHTYFEHHEDGVHITCDHGGPGAPDDGDYHGELEAPGQEDWAGQDFTGPGEITVPAHLIKLADGERVTTIYDLPGTAPILAIGITTRGSLLYGVRAGKGWAFEPQWIGRVSEPVSALQDTLEQVGAEQSVIDRQTHPGSLRQALRAELTSGDRTLAQMESRYPNLARRVLIGELAAMRDDGEVEFTGPRYRLVKG